MRLDPSQAMMKMFLRDRLSVNVHFIFASKAQVSTYDRLTCLWAHRLVLSRYPTVEALVENAIQDRGRCYSSYCALESTLKVPVLVPNFSLPVFSCMLYYLYTGKIQLNVRPDLFVLSQIDHDSVLGPHDCVPVEPDTVLLGNCYLCGFLPSVEVSLKPNIEWESTDASSSSSVWPVKGVSWKELYAIASHFAITELQEQCLEGMVASMDASNVVEILFEFGGSSLPIREAGLAFLNDHLEVLFVEGRDPFEGYREREGCYEILVEVMRSFTKRLLIASRGEQW